MNKYTIVLNRPTGAVSVQIEARNLGRAVRDAVTKVATLDGEAYAKGQYEVLFACDGWPHQYTPQECAAAAK